jgi:hypothetical protein
VPNSIASCARLARDLVPVTLVACAFLALLALWAMPRVAGMEGFTALYLAWISALTMPHMVVVAWLERASLVSQSVAGRDEGARYSARVGPSLEPA